MAAAYRYILFSPSLGKFYTGATTNTPEKRKDMHWNVYYCCDDIFKSINYIFELWELNMRMILR